MLEYLGEAVNPGDVGGVELGGNRPRPPVGWILLKVAVAAAIVGGALWAARRGGVPLGDARVIGGALAYLGIAWLIRPAPDASNMGWFGGLMDNPFRISDDWNRFLLFLMIALLPGRLVTDALEDLVRLPFGSTRQRVAQGGGEAAQRWRRPLPPPRIKRPLE